MHKLYELKEKLMDELEDYTENGKFSKDNVEEIKYLSSAIDHICNIIERADDEEYSMRGNSYRGQSSYRGGSSYARGGGSSRGYSRARRRDSMGRYSRASEDFKSELEELMQDAPNDQIRQRMMDMMNEM